MRFDRIPVPFILIFASITSTCQAQAINQSIVTFLAGKVGVRVGGGECAHAATEALRVSGGEFMPTDLGADTPSTGDYVWGTLVKIVSCTNGKWVDSSPTAKVLPGDIMQYGNTTIVIGNSTWTATHHTSIVAAVNTAGMPTFIFEQNVNGVRTIQKDAMDLTKLKAGWIRIYRPKARLDKTGRYKCTIVNNMPTSQSVAIKFGTQTLGSLGLTQANTASSYLVEMVMSSSATAKFTLALSTGSSITIDNAGGYEVYAGTGGKAAIRKLTP